MSDGYDHEAKSWHWMKIMGFDMSDSNKRVRQSVKVGGKPVAAIHGNQSHVQDQSPRAANWILDDFLDPPQPKVELPADLEKAIRKVGEAWRWDIELGDGFDVQDVDLSEALDTIAKYGKQTNPNQEK